MEKGDWQKRVAGHRERLRQKFLNHGLEKLTDEETIELLLTLGTPRRDCKNIAREALRRFQAPLESSQCASGLLAKALRRLI